MTRDSIQVMDARTYAPPLAIEGLDCPPWMRRGICAQTDPEAFFPEKGGSTREAKAICKSCPVAAECLDYALDHDERFGIWGGLSERERRKIGKAIGNPKTANARKTHCVNGHAFDEANTYNRPDGGRDCRKCLVQHQRNHRSKS